LPIADCGLAIESINVELRLTQCQNDELPIDGVSIHGRADGPSPQCRNAGGELSNTREA